MLAILSTVADLKKIYIADKELKASVKQYLSVLDKNYGQNRNIYEDDGGFAIIVNNQEELQEASEYIDLETDIYEYIEEINDTYICMLKLCNNEFSIMIYIRKVLCSEDVLDCLYGNDESGRV